MNVDCHVHTAALTAGHGRISRQLRRALSFRWLRHQLGIGRTLDDEATERVMERALIDTVKAVPELDAVVVLAFDAVYRGDGTPDDAATHFYVANDYVAGLAAREPRLLFGASVHPYRKDAVAEIERCVRSGAVLCKWLPLTQCMDPADRRCVPVYDALAHYGLPLLSHTGWEYTLPRLARTLAAPERLTLALERGVTVIAAHCAAARVPGEGSYLEQFVRMAREHERFYGDTSALNLPRMWRAYDLVLQDDAVRAKLLHGSDWPIPVFPQPWRHGWRGTRTALAERNQMRRDVLIKRGLGLGEGDGYWERAARVLNLGASGSRRAAGS